MSEEKKKEKEIEITVDTKRTEELAKQVQKLEDEKSQNELKKRIEEMNQQFNTDMFSQAENEGMLRSMYKSHIAELVKNQRPTETPSGSPLVQEQYTGSKNKNDLYTRKFEDYPSMIKTLREEANRGNSEAKEYLNQLTEKWAEWKRANPTTPEQAVNPNSPEALMDLHLKKYGDYLISDKGDIRALVEKWKKDRLRAMTGKTETQGEN